MTCEFFPPTWVKKIQKFAIVGLWIMGNLNSFIFIAFNTGEFSNTRLFIQGSTFIQLETFISEDHFFYLKKCNLSKLSPENEARTYDRGKEIINWSTN